MSSQPPAKSASPRSPAGSRAGRRAGALPAEQVRAQLLDAALVLFARRGIADTPLSAVAAQAGVTKAMVHYHFQTREHLLDVLVDERFMPRRRELSRQLQAAGNPAEALLGLARSMVAHAAEQPWMAPLWVREILSEGGQLRARMRARMESEAERLTVERIADWQQRGLLNPGLHPELLMMSLFGLTLLPMAAIQSGGGTVKALDADAVAANAVAMLTGGLLPARSS